MQFVYHKEAGKEELTVDVREYEHIFKVRRTHLDEVLSWRNLEDSIVYEYKITAVGKKEATLTLVSQKESRIAPLKELHVGWCVIDPKIIEKTLPMLNELGVTKISFIYADFSQKNHKLDFERMQRILINSSQQCGRYSLMKLETIASVKAFLTAFPKAHILDFSEEKLTSNISVESILVGPEGGFSDKERALFSKEFVVGLNCPTILRSETAVVAASSKILG